MTEGAAIEQAHAYLAAFLDRQRAEELAASAVGDAQDGTDPVAVLSAAHRRLRSEVRLTDDVAVDVLARDLGLGRDQIARILGVTPERVEEAVHRAADVERELAVETRDAPPVRYVFDTEAPPEVPTEEPPSEPPGVEEPEQRPRRRALTVVVGLAVVAALVLAVVTSLQDGATDDGPEDTTDVAGEVTVTQLIVTTEVTGDGPAPAQDRFTTDQPIHVWFAFEPPAGEAVVELALLRDGQEVIAPSFPLPQTRTDSYATLPPVVTDEPGEYRVEIRRDGRVLAETGFQIGPQ